MSSHYPIKNSIKADLAPPRHAEEAIRFISAERNRPPRHAEGAIRFISAGTKTVKCRVQTSPRIFYLFLSPRLEATLAASPKFAVEHCSSKFLFYSCRASSLLSPSTRAPALYFCRDTVEQTNLLLQHYSRATEGATKNLTCLISSLRPPFPLPVSQLCNIASATPPEQRNRARQSPTRVSANKRTRAQ